jgi:hypothetical protein
MSLSVRSFTDMVNAYFLSSGEDLAENLETLKKDNNYCRHFLKSQEAIVKAFDGLKNNALIVGVGAANDLPLRKITERFERVTLVDINLEQTKKALQLLPEELRQKCELKEADLSGYFSEMGIEIENIAKENPPYEDFTSKIVNKLGQLSRKEPKYFEGKASFVCSSMVSSQLPGGVIDVLNLVTQELYKKSFKPSSDDLKDFEFWCNNLEIAHLKEMKNFIAPGGRFYYADHFSVEEVIVFSSELEQKMVSADEENFDKLGLVEKCISENFSVINEVSWNWWILMKISVEHAELVEENGEKKVVPIESAEYRKYPVTSFTFVNK